MKKASPKLALVANQSADALRVLSCISSLYEVSTWSLNERVSTRFREERPALVLVLSGRHELERCAGIARSLKTERRPPLVALILSGGLPTNAQDLKRESLLDGVLGLPIEKAEWQSWFERVFSGDQPVEGSLRKESKLRQTVRRLSGFRAFSKDE